MEFLLDDKNATSTLCTETLLVKKNHFSGMRGYGYLKVHIEVVHEGIKRHECDICQKRFGTRQNMLKHIKSVHEGIKRKTDKKRSYPCDQCDHVAAR